MVAVVAARVLSLQRPLAVPPSPGAAEPREPPPPNGPARSDARTVVAVGEGAVASAARRDWLRAGGGGAGCRCLDLNVAAGGGGLGRRRSPAVVAAAGPASRPRHGGAGAAGEDGVHEALQGTQVGVVRRLLPGAAALPPQPPPAGAGAPALAVGRLGAGQRWQRRRRRQQHRRVALATGRR